MDRKQFCILSGSLLGCAVSLSYGEEIPVLSAVTVQSSQDKDQYWLPLIQSGTRTDVAQLDLPQSVDVRGQKLMEDLGGTQRTDELAQSVAGVNITWTGNGGSNIPILNFRGFSNSSAYGASDFLKDGYRKFNTISQTSDNANIDRIEFLKGPSSILFGNTNNIGGAINYISKRPVADPRQRFTATTGSFDFYRATMDVGTSLSEDKSALLRFNASFEDAGSYRDFAHHQTHFLAPAMSIDLTSRDHFIALLDYTSTSMRGDFGLPITPLFAQIPTQRYAQDKNFDQTNAWVVNSLFEYRHEFNERWSLLAGISSSWTDWNQYYTRHYVPEKLNNPLQIRREYTLEHSEQDDRNLEISLQGHFDWWGLQHNVLFGAGYITNNGYYDNELAKTTLVNLIQPDDSQPQIDWGINPIGRQKNFIENETFFVQDLIALPYHWKVLLGGRFDHVRQRTIHDQFFGSNGHDVQTDQHFSPRYGVVYQPTNEASIYTSYTTSFAQRINFSLDPNARYKPELGEQYEIGVKYMINPNFEATLALYQLNRINVLLNNFNNVPFHSLQTGSQQSRGLELSMVGQVNDNIRVTSAYSWMKAEVSKDNFLAEGTERTGVPRHTLNLFGVYAFSGEMSGLEIGTGLRYTSSAQVSMPNTFKLPDVVQWDAMIGYRFNKQYKVQFNVKNITDHKNYIVTDDFGYITPQTPLAFYANFNADF